MVTHQAPLDQASGCLPSVLRPDRPPPPTCCCTGRRNSESPASVTLLVAHPGRPSLEGVQIPHLHPRLRRSSRAASKSAASAMVCGWTESRVCTPPPLLLWLNPALKHFVMIPMPFVPQEKRRQERLRNLRLASSSLKDPPPLQLRPPRRPPSVGRTPSASPRLRRSFRAAMEKSLR
jgi:hypothetical protein